MLKRMWVAMLMNEGRSERTRATRSRVRSFKRTWLAGLAALLLVPSVSQATPTQYDFTSGYVTLWATVGGEVLVDPITVPLDGIHVTVDTAVSSLVDMQLTAPGPVALGFNQLYAGYDEIIIESLGISGGPGSLFEVDPGPPTEYFYVINPLTLALQISANGPAPALGEIISAQIITDTVGTGTLFLDAALNELTLTGLTLGSFDLGTGETPIVIKGDFVYTGEVPIPEPSTAVALTIVMATFAGSRYRRRRT